MNAGDASYLDFTTEQIDIYHSPTNRSDGKVEVFVRDHCSIGREFVYNYRL